MSAPDYAVPSRATSIRGCGCGRWHIPAGQEFIVVDGVKHRYSKHCVGEAGGVLPYQPTLASLSAEVLTLRDELKRAQERIRFLESALRVVEAPTSAWEAAHEPIDTFPAQDPEAAGFKREGGP